MVKEKQLLRDTYNTRVYLYPTATQVTIYSNPITINKKDEKCNKGYINENRTKEQEQHAINVSLAKTKNTIYNITRSNVWKWFITLTFDREKIDSSNYDETVKKLQKYLNNLQQRSCPNLKYLIVPELHADKTHYHFHGLLADCNELQFVFSGKFDKDSNKPIFNIPSWSYGFTTATIVEDTQKASAYITKYITKDTIHFLKNKKRFYTNRNTKRTEPLKINLGSVDDMEQINESFVKNNANAITYVKDTLVKDAHRQITYYETNNKKQIDEYIKNNTVKSYSEQRKEIKKKIKARIKQNENKINIKDCKQETLL